MTHIFFGLSMPGSMQVRDVTTFDGTVLLMTCSQQHTPTTYYLTLATLLSSSSSKKIKSHAKSIKKMKTT
jgi:hypothetical protein